MNVINTILSQLFQNTYLLYVLLFVFFVIWIVLYYRTPNVQKMLYPKEIIFIPETLRKIGIFILFILIPSHDIGIISIDDSKSIESIVLKTKTMFFSSLIIAIFISFITFILYEYEIFKNKKIIYNIKFLDLFNEKLIKIALSIISILLIMYTYGKLLNWYLLEIIVDEKIKATSTDLLQLKLDNENLISFLIIILISGYFVYRLISYFFKRVYMIIFYRELITATVYLKSGKRICNVFVYNPPFGEYIFVGDNNQESYAENKIAIKKEEIEFIHFHREFVKWDKK